MSIDRDHKHYEKGPKRPSRPPGGRLLRTRETAPRRVLRMWRGSGGRDFAVLSRPVEKNYGEMRPVEYGTAPLTENQRALLAVLTDQPQKPAELRAATGFTSNEVGSAVRSLSAKGYATRFAGGWVLDPNRRQEAA